MTTRQIFSILAFGITINAFGQKVNFPTGILYHKSTEVTDGSLITKEIVVSGYIAEVKQSPINKDTYFINFDGAFPKNTMTLIAYRNTYKGKLESLKDLKGKTIFVTGTVELDEKYRYKDYPLKPSIKLISLDQIKIVSDFKTQP